MCHNAVQDALKRACILRTPWDHRAIQAEDGTALCCGVWDGKGLGCCVWCQRTDDVMVSWHTRNTRAYPG
jgi:hypothetical protein